MRSWTVFAIWKGKLIEGYTIENLRNNLFSFNHWRSLANTLSPRLLLLDRTTHNEIIKKKKQSLLKYPFPIFKDLQNNNVNQNKALSSFQLPFVVSYPVGVVFDFWVLGYVVASLMLYWGISLSSVALNSSWPRWGEWLCLQYEPQPSPIQHYQDDWLEYTL